VGYVDVAGLRFALPGGRVLFDDLSLRVPSGAHVALVGANGVGKTTILRLIAERSSRRSRKERIEERPQDGVIKVDGKLGYMPQFVGTFGASTTVREFLLSFASPELRRADETLQRAEGIVAGPHGQTAQLRYANAIATWGEAGGYDAEVLWTTCTTKALGEPLEAVAHRRLTTLSGGEQKRLALEAFFRSDSTVLLLDEPDNFLDIAGKRWLEQAMRDQRKTILFVSHDRAMLAATADAIVTLEGHSAWTHNGPFLTYTAARQRRLEKIEEETRRYKEEHARIMAQINDFKRRAAYNDKFATRLSSARKKLARHEDDNAPRERPRDQQVRMNLRGGRTGKIALRVEDIEIPGLVGPFSTELYFGERVGVVGPNGSGKSHFLKLLAGEDIAHLGGLRLGARVEPALFSQLHERDDLEIDRSLVDHLAHEGLALGGAIATLKRYELHEVAHLPFSLLSGGQQARFQILLMEMRSPTMLLLDEPTDNLDIDSAEALEDALLRYEGTIIVVTHDRWFMRILDRFLVFDDDGTVSESLESPYKPAEVLA